MRSLTLKTKRLAAEKLGVEPAPRPSRLHDLLTGIAPPPAVNPAIGGLQRDSRAVLPGDVFVAVPGVCVDGAHFAPQAVQRGAVAIVAERPLPGLDAPVVVVPDAAVALGLLADRLAGEPSREVAVTGVTGTNGKTTTTFLLASLLEAVGRPTSLLGTVVNRVAGHVRPAAMTTPGALTVQGALCEARTAGQRDLVMEVSSHALDQRRVAGVRFRCGVFTNLSRDHLDYHGSMQAYLAAKARLFEGLAPDGVAVLNRRDTAAHEIAARTPARVIWYDWAEGFLPDGAEAAARVLGEGLEGTRLEVLLGGARRRLTLPLIGRFNVENALAASAAAWGLGVPADRVLEALRASPSVPGRMERVGSPSGPTVLVDYAHTPDALERALATLRPLVPRGGRLVAVFGCGGDRDRGKRPLMAKAVERYADLCVLTSDNPRSEDPAAIVQDVLAGFECPGRALVMTDRRQAIHTAVGAAGPDDLVLLAGKGHETDQILADRTIPFDDRQVAALALTRRRARAA